MAHTLGRARGSPACIGSVPPSTAPPPPLNDLRRRRLRGGGGLVGAAEPLSRSLRRRVLVVLALLHPVLRDDGAVRLNDPLDQAAQQVPLRHHEVPTVPGDVVHDHKLGAWLRVCLHPRLALAAHEGPMSMTSPSFEGSAFVVKGVAMAGPA